jgi:DtxR family Mn-dependent transcriptional regulator
MSDARPDMLTDEILEDCLQALQRSVDRGESATAAEVSAFARIAPATAEAAFRELRARGLLTTREDLPVLSSEGQRQAAALLRRHRLSERLLTDVLGLPWDRVHDEAMRLEHSLTPESEQRLVSLLRDPETCPHGVPIPGRDGSPPPDPPRPLATIPAGRRVRIVQVTQEDGGFLRYLASLGLLPDAVLVVEELAPFGGPMLIRVGEARYAVGRDVAGKILVRAEFDGPGPQRQRRRRRSRRPEEREE